MHTLIIFPPPLKIISLPSPFRGSLFGVNHCAYHYDLFVPINKTTLMRAVGPVPSTLNAPNSFGTFFKVILFVI